MSDFSIIRPTKRNLSQGLPWLLRQAPIRQRFMAMAAITLSGKESSFSVRGFIDPKSRARNIEVSPLTKGEIYRVKTEIISPERKNDFTILDVHAHPYLGDGFSPFSERDIESLLALSRYDELSWGFSCVTAILFQFRAKSPINNVSSAALSFLQTEEAGQVPEERESVNFRSATYNFLYDPAAKYLGLRLNQETRGQLIKFRIWLSREKERQNKTPFDQLMGESNDESFGPPPPCPKLPWYPAQNVWEEIRRRGLAPTEEVIEGLQIKGPFARRLAKAINTAAREGKVMPDETQREEDGTKHYYFGRNHPAFSPFREAGTLLFKDELEQQVDASKIPPDVTIEGPNGEKFEFFYPGTIQSRLEVRRTFDRFVRIFNGEE